MTSRTNFTIEDYGAERSSFAVAGIPISSANYDAQQTAVIALSDAIEGIIIGALRQRAFTSQVAFPDVTPIANQFAQRELKWFVTYRDTVTSEIQSCEIATPDLSLLVPGTDFMNTASGAGLTFVNAFESFVRSRDNNPVEVQGVRLVGRNI